MIGYIKGKATVVSKEFCFIEAGGIGSVSYTHLTLPTIA